MRKIRKFLEVVFSKGHKIIVDESEIVSTIKLIDDYSGDAAKVAYPGWTNNQKDRWYIKFKCPTRWWPEFRKELMGTIQSAEIIK